MTKPITELRNLAQHRAKAAARAKRYRENNRPKWAGIARDHRWKLKVEVISHYGKVCRCCGEEHIEFLAVHHLNGNGNADRLEKCGSLRGGTDFYRKLKQLGYPDGYGVLCHNCNQSLGFYGRCPHAA